MSEARATRHPPTVGGKARPKAIPPTPRRIAIAIAASTTLIVS
jgi:hypothetical protein